MTSHAAFAPLLERRVADLAELFSAIARTRMAGVPVMNEALRVEAVGFECTSMADDPAAAGIGILIAPWFMNLVRLPVRRDDAADGIGRTHRHLLGGTWFDFIGAHEPALGAFAACSLFSPMFEFADQAAAHATALVVLQTLRDSPRAATVMPLVTPLGETRPARRAFLFGRRAVSGATP